MDADWLLVETVGTKPVLVAEGREMKDHVPLDVFLRKHPDLAAIQTAIAETVATGSGLVSITPKADRVIRTEPVQMLDGRVHGVHVWSGHIDVEPPDRPTPGPLKWDLTLGEATGTVESLANAGVDPAAEPTTGRTIADDLSKRGLTGDEARLIAFMIDTAPGQSYCGIWEVVDSHGVPRRVGIVARISVERAEDDEEHFVARAMNLCGESDNSEPQLDQLVDPVLSRPSQSGQYRALTDSRNWHLLKWLDDPCPHYNWRANALCHPNDRSQLAPMTVECEAGPTSRVLRLPGNDGGWVPMHVTVDRVEVAEAICAGLVTLRLPTESELAAANLVDAATSAS